MLKFLLALFSLACAVLLWQHAQSVPTRHLDADELEHLNAAYFTSRGELIYRDFFENHPPLTALLLQPFVRSTQDPVEMIRAARWLMFGITLATVAVAAAWAGRWLGPIGAVTAPLLLLTNAFFRIKMIEVRPDVPAALLVTLALLTLGRGVDRRSWARVGASAALFVAAGLFTPKPVFAAAGAVLAGLWALRDPQATDWRADGLRYITAVGGGAVLAAGVAAAAMLAAGNLSGFIHDCIVLGSRVRVEDVAGLRRVFAIQSALTNPGFWLLALVGTALPTGRAHRGDTWVLRGALFGSAAGLLVIAAPLQQYYLTAIVPGALLGARAIAALAPGAASPEAPAPSGGSRRLATVLAVAAVASAAPGLHLVAVKTRGTMDAQIERMHRILALTPPDDRVLDHWTGLFLTRLAAYRYFFLNSDIQRLIPPAQLERDLHALIDADEIRVYIPGPHTRLLPSSVRARVVQEFRWDPAARVFYRP